MIRLFVLLVVILTIVWAKQSCYSCTSAADVDDLNGWYWGPYLSKQPLKMKFGSDYCNLTPWVAGGFVNDCHSKCFTWQYNYTDAKTKNPAYETIRGCASQVPDFPVPSSDTCQDILQSKGGPNSVGGPNAGPGYYSQFINNSLFVLNFHSNNNSDSDISNSSSSNNHNYYYYCNASF
uniref:Secreted protein n=1 Tax=Plectus sambesii TaxID=2011161 RepID=A0A914X7A6_9BILA